jgi:hypothetical protein
MYGAHSPCLYIYQSTHIYNIYDLIDYVEISTAHRLGEKGLISAVHDSTVDASWRATTKVRGPAYRRKRIR